MPIRINRVYTRTGDKGETGLAGGRRVAKDSPRIEAYGTVDELNAAVGIVRALNRDLRKHSAVRAELEEVLRQVQQQLFDLGADLATPTEEGRPVTTRIGESQVKEMEALMDRWQKDLKPLKSFVLPGGGKLSGFLHQCRTVCRRAERQVVKLSRQEDVGPWPQIYLNRLGDLFFVLSRWISHHLQEPETLWKGGLASRPRRR